MLNTGALAPILQFGTSRFLLAHVDLFVSEAMTQGQALGRITVVQTTENPLSAQRVAALARAEGYPVRIRGLQAGVAIDEVRECRAVQAAWQAHTDWPRVREAAMAAQVSSRTPATKVTCSTRAIRANKAHCSSLGQTRRTASRPNCWLCCTNAGSAAHQPR